MTKTSARAQAYSQYYLDRFKQNAAESNMLAEKASKRLATAEKQFAAGEMVTGTEDGIMDSLRGFLK